MWKSHINSNDIDWNPDLQFIDQPLFSTIVSNHPKLLKGLTDCGFINAAPIQVAALPPIIAGDNILVESKCGSGRSLTIVISTLMGLNIEQRCLQTLILAPRPKNVIQIQQCFKNVGRHLSDLKCEYFIGGISIDEAIQRADGCQIAVGCSASIVHLLKKNLLNISDVRCFILDGADMLISDVICTEEVRLIHPKLKNLKQMIAISMATDRTNLSLYDDFMKEYTVVQGSGNDMNVSKDPSKFQLGIKQYIACVKAVSTSIILLPAKNVRLLSILKNIRYTKCIIYTNYMTRVEAICNMLRDHHYKAEYIRSDQNKNIQLKILDKLVSSQLKILVTTDLIARQIDSSNIDLVINMDCPYNWATYLHRIGRAARIGNNGHVFTILDDDNELTSFKCITKRFDNVNIKMLPIAIQKPILEYEDDELEDLNVTTVADASTNNSTEENENSSEEDTE